MMMTFSQTCRSLFSRSNISLQQRQLVFSSTSTMSFNDKDYKYDVPRYTKVNAWDKDSKQLKVLGKILSSKRDRTESDSVVLEGIRMIREAISLGHTPSIIVFSREKLLHQLEFGGHSSTKLYHLPYTNIKMWSDLNTSPGIMAAFSKRDLVRGAVAASPVTPALTLICDNVRTPDNLGAVIRVAAAAGARQIICTRGCVNAWSPKVVRAAAGAHFLIPIIENMDWGTLKQQNVIDNYPYVLLSDLDDGSNTDNLDKFQDVINELETEFEAEGEERSYSNPELCERYRGVPLATIRATQLTSLAGFREAVVVVGGETEGVSDAAHMFCHRHQGARLSVPLRNNVNSLNVISAASLVLFRVRDALENSC